MRSVTDGLVGIIIKQTYRIELWEKNPPKLELMDLKLINERWLYITKYHHNGQIENRSLGFSKSDLPELITLLNHVVY